MLNLEQKISSVPITQPKIITLKFHDKIGFEPQPMRELYLQYGQLEAEERICRSLEQVAYGLELAHSCHKDCDFARLNEIAEGIATNARQIGLTAVAQTADDVAVCAARGDASATASTLHRLGRISEPSMVELWTIYDEAP